MASPRQSRHLLATCLCVLTCLPPSLAAGCRPVDGPVPGFFPDIRQLVSGRHFLPNCTSQFNNYINESLPDPPNAGHQVAWGLIDRILQNMQEVAKVELAISAMLLALLPTALALIGPGQVETGLLSVRRPLLALLLEVGTPSPNPSRSNIYATPVEALGSRTGVEWLSFLDRFPLAARAALAVVEYAVAMTAAGNCIYQIYRLTYKAVALAPVHDPRSGTASSSRMGG